MDSHTDRRRQLAHHHDTQDGSRYGGSYRSQELWPQPDTVFLRRCLAEFEELTLKKVTDQTAGVGQHLDPSVPRTYIRYGFGVQHLTQQDFVQGLGGPSNSHDWVYPQTSLIPNPQQYDSYGASNVPGVNQGQFGQEYIAGYGEEIARGGQQVYEATPFAPNESGDLLRNNATSNGSGSGYTTRALLPNGYHGSELEGFQQPPRSQLDLSVTSTDTACSVCKKEFSRKSDLKLVQPLYHSTYP